MSKEVRLFTKKELESQIDEILQLPRPSVAVTRFSQFDFEVPDDEEEIQIHRGFKVEYKGATHFWVRSLLCLEQGESQFLGPGAVRTAALSALCRAVDQAELASLTQEKLSFLGQAWSLHLGGQIAGAIVMDQSTDAFSVLWETDTLYGAFFWSTTA